MNGQQLIRVDEESTESYKDLAYEFIIKKFKKELPAHDVVILSDYNKGIFSRKLTMELIKISNKFKIPIIVDPKNKDFNIYKNAFLITPNQLETTIVTNLPCNNDKEAEDCGKFIINKFSIKKCINYTRR